MPDFLLFTLSQLIVAGIVGIILGISCWLGPKLSETMKGLLLLLLLLYLAGGVLYFPLRLLLLHLL